MERVVVVGASLAGARAADALRRLGFAGEIVAVGEEPHPPYERPPLSKQVLAGKWDLDKALVRLPDDIGVSWRLGVSASAMDMGDRRLFMDDGSDIGFDGLVIATGASPRRISGTEGLDGVFTLRTIEDALAIRKAASPPDCKVVVVGGGFIGCEVASTLGANGAKVTIVDPLPNLMGRALGDDFADFFAELHFSNGVDLRLGVGVDRLESAESKVVGCTLSDGTRLDCDMVVVGIGVVPATGWLSDSGLKLDERDSAVMCDATCAVLGSDGCPVQGVVAAGDVARWDHELFDRPIRVEHWENATAMAEAAARRLLNPKGPRVPYTDVPFFWSDQWGKKIQFVGVRNDNEEVRLLEGSPAEGRFLATYSTDGILTGALGVGRAARIVAMRNAIAARTPVSDLLE